MASVVVRILVVLWDNGVLVVVVAAAVAAVAVAALPWQYCATRKADERPRQYHSEQMVLAQ